MSNKVKVCLDAGHVGSKYNQSPVVKTYYESAMVWSLHLKLKAALEALAEAGILDSPETWAGRFGRDMTEGEAVGIKGKLLAWMRTAGENPAG